MEVGNDLYIRHGVVIGEGGLLVNGPIGVSVASLSNTIASTSFEPLFRLNHSRGYLAGDALQINVAATVSQGFFSGNYARFTTSNTNRIILESSGAILASGAAQFGSAGAPTSVSYSRFGTSATTHLLSAASDVLISGKFEVDSSASFNGQLIIKNTLSTSTVASISATSLTSGNLIDIQIPTSSSFTGSIIKATDSSGRIVFRVKSGGELAARQGIFSHGSISNCTGVDTPSTGCIDYAEDMPTSDTTLSAGELVSIDLSKSSFSVARPQKPYDSLLIGIVSTKPAIVIGNGVKQGDFALQREAGIVPIALSGRVPVKISTENGSIKKGDYLTSSSTSGKAMRAIKPGRVVGIALEDGDTEVMMFVNPHYAGTELDIFGKLADFSSAKTTVEKASFQDMFANILSAFKDAVLSVTKLIAKQIETDDITVKNGISTYDKGTEQLVCIQVNNGIITSTPGSCSSSTTNINVVSPSPSNIESTNTPTPSPDETVEPTPVVTEEPTPETTEEPTPSPDEILIPETTLTPEAEPIVQDGN